MAQDPPASSATIGFSSSGDPEDEPLVWPPEELPDDAELFWISDKAWLRMQQPCMLWKDREHRPSDDDALLLMNFFFTEDDSLGWKCRSVLTRIGLDTSPKALCEYLRRGCTFAQHENNDFMLRLKKQGQGLQMKAVINFDTTRDFYVNADEFQLCRWQSVRDLFGSEELIETRKREHGRVVLPVDLETTIIPWPDAHSYALGAFNFDFMLREFHLIGSYPLKETQVGTASNQHLPLSTACIFDVQRCPPRNLLADFPIHFVAQRVINGVPVGEYHESLSPSMAAADVDLGGTNIAWAANRAFAEVRAGERTPRHLLPRSPPMTFNDLVPRVREGELPTGEVHLAIRVVHRLQYLLHGRKMLTLPRNILMTVSTGRRAEHVVGKTLSKSLYAWARSNPQKGGNTIMQLFTPELHDEWDYNFWIMPQSDKMEKMHMWEGQALKWFLSSEGVKKGDRTLYVEAHLIEVADGDFGKGPTRGR